MDDQLFPETYRLTLQLISVTRLPLPDIGTWKYTFDDWGIAYNPSPILGYTAAPPTMEPAYIPAHHVAFWFRGLYFGSANPEGETFRPHALATPEELRIALTVQVDQWTAYWTAYWEAQ